MFFMLKNSQNTVTTVNGKICLYVKQNRPNVFYNITCAHLVLQVFISALKTVQIRWLFYNICKYIYIVALYFFKHVQPIGFS